MTLATEILGNESMLVRRIRAAMEERREAARRRAVYNRTYRELASLSRRDLDDIGISHDMIADIAHDAAYGK